jgi:hypothetical protein
VLRTTGAYISDLSASADGKRLACVKFRAQFDVFVAALPEGRREPEPPRRLTLDEHSDLVSGWTPDGRSVLFLSTRVEPPALFRQGLEDRVATPLLSDAPGTALAAVTPDGRWILYQSARGPLPRLMRVPVAGGAAEVVASLDTSSSLVGCGTREGAPCVFQRWNGDQLIFLAVDPGSGTSRELTRIAVDPRAARQVWGLSPDGLHAATDTPSGPMVVELRPGGSSLPRQKGWEDAAFLCWAGDGGLWLGRSAEDGLTQLVHSDLAGHLSAVETLDFFQLSASPDGRWLAFDRMTRDANAWLLEGF